MAIFVWICTECSSPGRRILPKRPQDLPCPKCGGKTKFLTSATTSTKEVIDNGLMYKPIERSPNIEAELKERNELAEKEEDPLV